jgi:hypothetical protein
VDAGGVTAPGAPLTTLATAAGATAVCGAATAAVATGTLTNIKIVQRHKRERKQVTFL